MDSMRDFFKRIKSRPMVFLLMMLISLIISTAEAYNPVIKSYGSFSYILKHNYMKTLSGWTGTAKEFLDTGGSAVYVIFMVIIFIFLLSMLASVLLSGYINILLSSVNGSPKKRGEFSDGIRKNFIKVTLYIFSFIILSVIFFFFLLYSVLPAVSMLRMFLDGDTSIIFTMLLICILTVTMMFLAIVFYALYFSYILPSIAGFRKSSLRIGVKMSNLYCWYLLPKTVLFLFLAALIRAALFVIHYGHSSLALSIVVLLITTILRTFLYYIYFYFVFNTFVAMREDLYPDYNAEIVELESGGTVTAPVPAEKARKENVGQRNMSGNARPRRHTVKADTEDPSEVTYTTVSSDSTNNESDENYDDSFEP